MNDQMTNSPDWRLDGNDLQWRVIEMGGESHWETVGTLTPLWAQAVLEELLRNE